MESVVSPLAAVALPDLASVRNLIWGKRVLTKPRNAAYAIVCFRLGVLAKWSLKIREEKVKLKREKQQPLLLLATHP